MSWIQKALGGAALFCLGACAGPLGKDAEAPDVSLAGLSFDRPGLFEQELTVSLRVRNPNDFAIPFEGLNFALDVNDAHFANGRSRRGFELPALGETVVPVTISVPTSDLIERVVAIGTGRRLGYRLTGAAELGNFFGSSIPFLREGELALPDLPRSLSPPDAAAPPEVESSAAR